MYERSEFFLGYSIKATVGQPVFFQGLGQTCKQSKGGVEFCSAGRLIILVLPTEWKTLPFLLNVVFSPNYKDKGILNKCSGEPQQQGFPNNFGCCPQQQRHLLFPNKCSVRPCLLNIFYNFKIAASNQQNILKIDL